MWGAGLRRLALPSQGLGSSPSAGRRSHGETYVALGAPFAPSISECARIQGRARAVGVGVGQGWQERSGGPSPVPTPAPQALPRVSAVRRAGRLDRARSEGADGERDRRRTPPKPKTSKSAVALQRRGNCYGCGIQLQTDATSAPGFVDPAVFDAKKQHKQLDRVLCDRCHRLSNGKMVPGVQVRAAGAPLGSGPPRAPNAARSSTQPPVPRRAGPFRAHLAQERRGGAASGRRGGRGAAGHGPGAARDPRGPPAPAGAPEGRARRRRPPRRLPGRVGDVPPARQGHRGPEPSRAGGHQGGPAPQGHGPLRRGRVAPVHGRVQASDRRGRVPLLLTDRVRGAPCTSPPPLPTRRGRATPPSRRTPPREASPHLAAGRGCLGR